VFPYLASFRLQAHRRQRDNMARRLSLVIAALSLALAPAWSFSPIASLVRSHRSGTSQRAVVALRCSQEPDVASRKIEGMSRRNALISMAGLGVLAFSGMASVAASPVKPVQSTSAELEGVLDGKSEWQTVLDNRPSVRARKERLRNKAHATFVVAGLDVCEGCSGRGCAGCKAP